MTDFGTDTSCLDSLRTGRLVSGTRLVAEAAYRRLTTPRGTLRGGEDEAHYGLDLTALVGSASPNLIAATLPGQIQAELRKDERIETVDVTVVVTTSGPSTRFDVTIDGTTSDGAFTLVVGVDSVTVELLNLAVAA